GAGGDGGSRAAVEVRLPRGYDADREGLGAEGAGGGSERDRRSGGSEAGGGDGQVHSGAGARGGRCVLDAGGRRVFDLWPRHGGDGAYRARRGEGERRGGDRRDSADDEDDVHGR